MPKVFTVQNGGQTSELDRVRCRDEELELQLLLEKNFDLLPGDQIRPEDPRRWLLIKREMSVPDPSTGTSRWSVDFLFADQDAIPTFVECKRFADTRARREVVGQMLEYAANGHHYWSRDELRDYAASSAGEPEFDLDSTITALNPETNPSSDDFFRTLERNLRDGTLRLIFFMEEAPFELKSIVEFLNNQMERSEVLIVEARQFEQGGLRVIVPTLFGYTEEARRVKVSTPPPGGRRKWDYDSFFADTAQRLDPDEVAALERFHRFASAHADEIRWGTGRDHGSFNVVLKAVSNRSVVSANSLGKLYLNFGWLEGAVAEAFRDRMSEVMSELIGSSLPEDHVRRFPALTAEEWIPKQDQLEQALQRLFEEYTGRSV